MKNAKTSTVLRRLALFVAACFSWTFILAAATQAATYKPPQDPGQRRLLSDKEMARIMGSALAKGDGDGGGDTGSGGGGTGTGGTFTDAAASPGPAAPWIGSVGGVKTYTGNKLTSLPIVSWTQRGGLPVGLTLYHNSLSSRSGEIGPKWSHSYDCAVMQDGSGNATVYWGDGRVCTFLYYINGTYAPPTGIHDTLVKGTLRGPGGVGIPCFTLTTKEQARYLFVVSATPTLYPLSFISDENNNEVQISYVSGTQLVQSITDATGRAITLGYSGGRLSTITDPKQRQWTINYTSAGDLSYVTEPSVPFAYSHRAFVYTAHNITQIQDRNGNQAYLNYNSDNTLNWEKDNVGNPATQFLYGVDGSGNANPNDTTIVDPNGHKTVHTYNAAGQLASVTDALGYTEYYTYDGANNVTQKQDRRGFLWNYTYDGNGNVLTAKDPYTNTTTFTYNAHSKPLTITKQMGRSVAMTYDASDNLTQVQEKNASGTVLATTTYTVSSATYGLVTAKTDNNNHKTLYGYDGNGYLNGSVTPAGRQYLWYYDALGFLTGRTDPMNRTTSYTPDAWERRTATTYPDNTTATFGYDPNGNLTSFANYAAGWTRAYDADNRILSESCNGFKDIGYVYDVPGQKGLKSSFTDYTGRTVSYAYTARNELAAVADPAGTTTYQYDPNGSQISVSKPNGRTQTAAYNNDGTLSSASSLVTSSGYAFEIQNFGYNADDQLTSAHENSGTPSNTTYAYDGQGRLSEANRTSDSPYYRVYTCDGAGNRTVVGGTGLSGPMTYDADDELTGYSWNNGNTSGSATFGYDADGQRTTETAGITPTFAGYATQYGYDFDGQLTSITKPGSTTTFRYDPLGRQVSRAVNGVLTGYGFDGGQLILEEVNNSVTATYTWGNGLIRRNGEYPLTDGRGNVRHVTDGSGNYLATTLADPFGVTSASSGSSPNPYVSNASSGYRSDGDGPAGTGPTLVKVGARYYDAQFGVFLTRDTELDQKPYAYCDGDPVNYTDPSGHRIRWVPIFWILGGLYVGGTGIFISVVSAPTVGGLVVGSLMAGAGGAMVGKGIRIWRGGE